MASVSFDLVQLSRRFDQLDPKGPNDRNLQAAAIFAQSVAAVLREVTAAGSGKYLLPENYAEADRSAAETALAGALTAVGTLNGYLNTLWQHPSNTGN